MRVVVIGATGNVGTSVVEALRRDPEVDPVVGVARRLPEGPTDGVEWRAADVVTDDLDPILTGADAVVHLAWLIQPSRDRATTRAVNVEGSRRVFEATARAGVPALVHASSIGAYSPGPKDRGVDESWPTEGIPTSFYSVDKAEAERLLDRLERERPELRVVRLRPGLIFKREAATEIRRLFLGPLFPGLLARPELIPVVPRHERLRVQAVHSYDVAEAYRLAAVGDVRGAFNVAADPVLDSEGLAALLGARTVPVPGRALRLGAAAAWRTRLIPTPEGWVDLAFGVPLMDTTRARTELGWTPQFSAEEALLDLLAGLREGGEYPTPPLAREASGPLRIGELRTGVGARL